MNVAALIADVVQSREIVQRAEFQRTLKTVLSVVSKRSRKRLLSPFTLTLGDEFQAVYGSFDSLFADIFEIIHAIFPEPIRFAIAYGPLSTEINPRAALGMDGRAFSDARDLLHGLKKQQRSIIQLAAMEPFETALADISLRLLANEMQTWTRNTCSVFHSLVQGASVEEAALRSSITRRGAYKAIATHHLRDYIELLESLTAELTRWLQAGEEA